MPMIQEEFRSVEAQMGRLREIASIAPPPIAGGSKTFFSSLDAWLLPREGAVDSNTIVLPDPSLNLSLPYPIDELRLAAQASAPRVAEEDLIARSGLSLQVLERPVTALSGGERMLVSISKASLLSRLGGQLIVCSPFFWLDPAHRLHVRNLLAEAAGGDSVTVRLLTLQGESDGAQDKPVEKLAAPAGTEQPLQWALSFCRSTVVFPASRFPRETPEKRLSFLLPAGSVMLRSPTLLSGANGVGKSTMAKLLAGLLTAVDAGPKIITEGFSGPARLLMQDTTVQLFGNSPLAHLDRVFRHDKDRRKGATELFNAMQDAAAKYLVNSDPFLSVGARESPQTLFQAKLALVAERLASRYPLLILDEPAWCLSKSMARVFLRVVLQSAHEKRVAVALVSHQHDWWEGITADRLQLVPSRDAGDEVVVERAGDQG